MKYQTINVPHINVNDNQATISKIHVKERDLVIPGQVVCEIESTKTNIEIESVYKGYISFLRKKGDVLNTGDPIAHIFFKYNDYKNKNISILKKDLNKVVSKRASLLMKENNLSLSDFEDYTLISYNTVINKIKSLTTKRTQIDENIFEKNYLENDIILYGDYNSNVIAKEIFEINQNFFPKIFIPSNENYSHDIDALSFATIDHLEKFFSLGLKHIFICSFESNKKISLLNKKLIKIGYKLISCFHPSAIISPSSSIGHSTIILPNSIIGPYVKIGNNCKILNKVSIAHHSSISDNVTIADGTTIGGNVIINQEAYIGIGVNINKRIEIGSNTTVVSGATVIDFLKSNSIHLLDGSVKTKKNNDQNKD